MTTKNNNWAASFSADRHIVWLRTKRTSRRTQSTPSGKVMHANLRCAHTASKIAQPYEILNATALRAVIKAICCQLLDLGLKIIDAIKPKIIAAAMPAAPAVSPPVKIPKKPSSSTAFFTPFARVHPNPLKGIVAPAPAKSTSF